MDGSTSDRARVIAAAITDHRVVRLCYGDAGANVTIREVEPVTCLVHRDHWYLVGWCRMRRGVRAFRFDRILAVESTGLRARPAGPTGTCPFNPGATPGTPLATQAILTPCCGRCARCGQCGAAVACVAGHARSGR